MRTVREIAVELGVGSDEVLHRLREMGHPAAGDLSAVEPGVAARLRVRMASAAAAGSQRTASLSRPPPPPPPPRPDAANRPVARFEPGAQSSDGRATGVLPRGGPPPPPPASNGEATGLEGPDATERLAPVASPELEPADSPGDPWDHESALPAPPMQPRRAKPAPASSSSRWATQLAELPVLILLAFVIAVLIKTFLVQAFFIPSGSMFPTLHVGDRVLVEKVSYRFRDPRAKDVVVFAKSVFGEEPELPWYQDTRNFMRELLGLPTGTEQDYIKRIVAIEGDTIAYSGKPRQLSVNGTVVSEPYLRGRDRFSPTLTGRLDCERLGMEPDGPGCVVPDGKVFVMGDNRGNSEDSRAIGPIDQDKIVGHAFVIIWPPGDFGGL